jgi:mannose-6-phosphate isomerase-like protein (cupin superfamily)
MDTGVAYTKIDPDGEERFQRLRQELGVSAFGLNLIRLRAGERGRIHRHDRQEEVYLVLEGTLTLLIEDEPRDLERGELARVAPDVRRQLVNRRPEPLLLLALGGANEHVGRDGAAYGSWDEQGAGNPPKQVPLPDNVSVG